MLVSLGVVGVGVGESMERLVEGGCLRRKFAELWRCDPCVGGVSIGISFGGLSCIWYGGCAVYVWRV